MPALLPRNSIRRNPSEIMRGKKSSPRSTPFAQWLYNGRTDRGLTMVTLAERAGVSHPRIVQLEQGDKPSRDMVKKIARALVPEDAGEDRFLSILNSGLRVAGFASIDENDPDPFLEEIREAGVIEDLPRETQEEILDYIKFKASQERKKSGGS